jgi:hypothetical protein
MKKTRSASFINQMAKHDRESVHLRIDTMPKLPLIRQHPNRHEKHFVPFKLLESNYKSKNGEYAYLKTKTQNTKAN